MDVALGGQGAPIVPVGERLLLQEYSFFLNLGGIANISAHRAGAAGPGQGGDEGKPGDGGRGAGAGNFVAFDVCPANRVLNMLAGVAGKEYDDDGAMAGRGKVDDALLERLNALPYYGKPHPKSLANEFGTETVWPMIQEASLSTEDALRTYVEHIAIQIRRSLEGLAGGNGVSGRMLVTGGGAHNGFLIGRLAEWLSPLGIEVVVPDAQLVDYKEALVMALIGVLRWREENNVYASVTGASRDSIGGAVWIGQEV
jgi:anhydro-N-acetylmuramic acid kinase